MLAAPTQLDADLLAEFEGEAREAFARLLAVLLRAVHHPVGSGGGAEAALEAFARLADAWAGAKLLHLSDDAIQARFPLADRAVVRIVADLAALAAYSDGEGDEYAGLCRLIDDFVRANAPEPAAARPLA